MNIDTKSHKEDYARLKAFFEFTGKPPTLKDIFDAIKNQITAAILSGYGVFAYYKGTTIGLGTQTESLIIGILVFGVGLVLTISGIAQFIFKIFPCLPQKKNSSPRKTVAYSLMIFFLLIFSTGILMHTYMIASKLSSAYLQLTKSM